MKKTYNNSHELGHIVQQASGNVKPKIRVNAMLVNDSTGVERGGYDGGRKC